MTIFQKIYEGNQAIKANNQLMKIGVISKLQRDLRNSLIESDVKQAKNKAKELWTS